MVKATLWILGTEYIGRGQDRNDALKSLNDKWQAVCDTNPNIDRRRISQIAEHIKYINE